IGVSIARNAIGWDLDSNNQPTVSDPAQVRAYVEDTSINASGKLLQTATASESIDALGLGFSVASAGGGPGGALARTGAGSSAINKLSTDVMAFIDGDGADGISATSITLTAADTSKITANVAAASLGLAASGSISGSLSVGVSLADNTIGNRVDAYIQNGHSVTARAGDIRLTANVPLDEGDFPHDFTTASGTRTLPAGAQGLARHH